ncbi:ABC transporter permease [Falsirhodobacter halotolerans]|uniref:ABC transporter permease n=1 Tax=Falsirhodobacter halotolerans TaxID=1146892 RepID=UPI001FD3BE5E|nr:ABC transporter permease [Falsirhodobacter halotolerans]MCJ8139152.1 ABC transporter permease [Falsirhodobacter halotolerans]
MTTSTMPRLNTEHLANYAVLGAFFAILVYFSVAAPGFLSADNLFNLVVNNVVLLAIVALGMTIVISSGGIDLSVGISLDMAAMVFVMLLAAGMTGGISVAGGIAAAGVVGMLNAILITRLRISPFLATLGILFIGQSVQRLATQGGQPIYLTRAEYAGTFNAIARSTFLGIPTPVWVMVGLAIAVWVLLHRSVFGRYVRALGAQPGVAWYSGIRVPRNTAMVYILCALLCGVSGIILSSTVRSYVPLSGDGYLLDAIGATFIGTTLSAERRPSVIGTIMGVLLLGVMRNGLLLIGWNFYWQQVGIGVLVFAVLAISFGLKGRAD